MPGSVDKDKIHIINHNITTAYLWTLYKRETYFHYEQLPFENFLFSAVASTPDTLGLRPKPMSSFARIHYAQNE